jgi:hypothetical protein
MIETTLHPIIPQIYRLDILVVSKRASPGLWIPRINHR